MVLRGDSQVKRKLRGEMRNCVERDEGLERGGRA
jgi:hypothetical protein